MLTLTPTLDAALRARTRRPAISLVHMQLRNAVPQLDWSQWYDGSETDTPHASCVAPDGSLIRVRNASGTVQVSRVASPTSGDTYSSWTSLGAGAVSGTGIALASGPSRIIMVYVKTGQLRLTYRSSTDNGANWSAGGDVIASNESANITWPAIATLDNNNDDWIIFWARGGTLLRRTISTNGGSSWGAATSITISSDVGQVTGLAAWGTDDYNVVMTGYKPSPNTGAVALVAMYGQGVQFTNNTFSTWLPLANADQLSTISFMQSPWIVSFQDTCIAGFNERETGNVAYTRSYQCTGQPGRNSLGYFSEPSPLEALTANGAQMTVYSGDFQQWFYTTCDGVWSASYDATESELAGFLVKLSAKITPESGKLTAAFTRGYGVLGSNNLPPDVSAVAVGSTLALRAGYLVDGVAEYGTTWTFEVSRVAWKTSKNTFQLTLEGIGPWERARYTRSRQTVYQAGASASRALYFGRALARAGGVYVQAAGSPHAPSADWTTDHSPDFLARPGDSWAAIAKWLSSTEAEGVYFDGVNGYVRSVATTDTADEDYHNEDAAKVPIVSLELEETAPNANWVRLSSASRYTDAYLQSSIYRAGPRMTHEFEADADDNTKAAEYVAAALARHRYAQKRATLQGPAHPGLQLYDVVSVEDGRISFSQTSFRVTAIALDYDRANRGQLDQTLELSAL